MVVLIAAIVGLVIGVWAVLDHHSAPISEDDAASSAEPHRTIATGNTQATQSAAMPPHMPNQRNATTQSAKLSARIATFDQMSSQRLGIMRHSEPEGLLGHVA
jgi:hypothetical protein